VKGLTAKQEHVLILLHAAKTQTNKTPSVRELCRMMDLSSSCTVQRHLEALEKKGFLLRTGRYRFRAWEITAQGRSFLGELSEYAALCHLCDQDAEGGELGALLDRRGRRWCQRCAVQALGYIRSEALFRVLGSAPQLFGNPEQLPAREPSGIPGELEVTP